jgi:hypothetical protein
VIQDKEKSNTILIIRAPTGSTIQNIGSLDIANCSMRQNYRCVQEVNETIDKTDDM